MTHTLLLAAVMVLASLTVAVAVLIFAKGADRPGLPVTESPGPPTSASDKPTFPGSGAIVTVSGMKKSVASHPRQLELRVVVKAGLPPPNPYAWALVDDITREEVRVSFRRFRTLSLAWDDGVSALGHLTRHPDGDDRERFGS
jgi:hypothetical protein